PGGRPHDPDGRAHRVGAHGSLPPPRRPEHGREDCRRSAGERRRRSRRRRRLPRHAPRERIVLELEGLDAGYGEARAVAGVSLRVAAGEIVALLGPNGAGKSTLLCVVAGLVAPRAGTIRWEGEDLTRLRAHRIVERGLVLVPEGRR